jgi:hypothetical protein
MWIIIWIELWRKENFFPQKNSTFSPSAALIEYETFSPSFDIRLPSNSHKDDFLPKSRPDK